MNKGKLYYELQKGGLSYEEIAQAYGGTKGTVMTLAYRYRKENGIKSARVRNVAPKEKVEKSTSKTLHPDAIEVLEVIHELRKMGIATTCKEIKKRTKHKSRRIAHLLRDMIIKGYITSHHHHKSNFYVPTEMKKDESYREYDPKLNFHVLKLKGPAKYCTGFGLNSRNIGGVSL